MSDRHLEPPVLAPPADFADRVADAWVEERRPRRARRWLGWVSAAAVLVAAVLALQPEAAPEPARPLSATLRVDGDRMAMVELLATTEAVPRRPVRVAFLVDTSESMRGRKLRNVKAAVVEASQLLAPGDRVSVVGFDSHVDVVLRDHEVAKIRGAVKTAVEGLGPRGTTCLECGLAAVYALPVDAVVVVSDGEVTVGPNTATALAERPTQAARRGVRTSTVGLGRAYDASVLQAITNAGLGAYAFAHNSDLVAKLLSAEVRRLAQSAAEAVRVGDTAVGRVARGEHRRVLLPVPAGDRMAVTVRYRDTAGRAHTLELTARVDPDRPNAEVAREVAYRKTVEAIDQALQQFATGQTASALQTLELNEVPGDAAQWLEQLAGEFRTRLQQDEPDTDWIETQKRAWEGRRFERVHGQIGYENNINGGAGVFKANELE